MYYVNILKASFCCLDKPFQLCGLQACPFATPDLIKKVLFGVDGKSYLSNREHLRELCAQHNPLDAPLIAVVQFLGLER